MSLQLPVKEWWTAQELADAGLPDLPNNRQGVDHNAKRNGWREQPAFARPREGRGGGWEYHWRLLPVRAQRALIMQAGASEEPQPKRDRAEVWAWFDALPESVKDKAKRNGYRPRLRLELCLHARCEHLFQTPHCRPSRGSG